MSEQMHIEVFGDDEELTFNLNVEGASQPIEIHVGTTSGETSVQATGRDDIQVWLEINGRSAHHPVVTASWDGTRLNIAPAKNGGIERVLRGSPGFDVRIEVPRSLMPEHGGHGVVARLQSASGEISVGELAGDLRLTTASGDLSLERVAGKVECHSASGDVSIEQISGQLRVNTASGDVSIEKAILDRWEINTVSGNVESGMVLSGAGPYRVNTVSGDANLRVGVLSGAGVPDAFTLESQTMSGDIEVDGMARKLGRRRWHLGAGERPSAAIRLTTVSGDASVTVEPAAVNGDLGAATGFWADHNLETDGAHGNGVPKDRTWSDLDADIDSRVAAAMSKVDWVGIDQTVNEAIDSAVGRSAGPPTAPQPPVQPTPPTVPSAPAAPGPAVGTTPVEDVESPGVATSSSGNPTVMTEEERRLDILRRIEQGDLSVEDGMAQLDTPGETRI